MVVVVVMAGCPRDRVTTPAADSGTAAPGRPPAVRADAKTPRVPAGLPDGPRWDRCDGDIALEDIPDRPLAATIAGKQLRPTAMVVRGSLLGKQIAFDFALPHKWSEKLPCFIAERRLLAGFKRVSEDFARRLELRPGEYRLGEGWQAYYDFESAGGRRVHETPPAFYGLLVLERSSGLDRKPQPMFTPTGRVKGRVALCFGDAQGSWIAGTFDVPACGDARP